MELKKIMNGSNIVVASADGTMRMIYELLPHIRKDDERAIVFDVTGDLVDRFYNPETDTLLNPLQEGSVNWLPWNDCETDEEYYNLAGAFVNGESFSSDCYWGDASRAVLVEAFKKESSSKSIEAMLQVINRAELKDLCKHFADTDAAGYVSKEAEKGTAAVREILIHKIEQLRHLKDGGDFSIKNWVNSKEKSGWLFISGAASKVDVPLLSAWANVAIKAMHDRPHFDANKRTWFVMNEMPIMQKTPFLSTMLSQGFLYGSCAVVDLKNINHTRRLND
jgi:hypothetical protein